MAKIINEPSDVVGEMLASAALTNPAIKLLDGYHVVVRAALDKTKVAVISGGGSGHEPSHAGWVADGMLSAAVCGNVFASPSTASVLAAIMHCTGAGGCLLIVKNYTGDRLNFGLAAEQAKAAGLAVELLVVGDDCAIAHRGAGIAGRRGIAGTCFVHKVAGAAASPGALPTQTWYLPRTALCVSTTFWTDALVDNTTESHGLSSVSDLHKSHQRPFSLFVHLDGFASYGSGTFVDMSVSATKLWRSSHGAAGGGGGAAGSPGGGGVPLGCLTTYLTRATP